METVTQNLENKITCTLCNGTGKTIQALNFYTTKGKLRTCRVCRGLGKITKSASQNQGS